MTDQAVLSASAQGVETALRTELARADFAAGGILPVLRHFVAATGSRTLNDEVLARVRGMLAGLVRELQPADPAKEAATQDPPDADLLTAALSDNSALLAHLHAAALEWQLGERLQTGIALDEVVSPLLQSMISADDADAQSMAMRFLAAQNRWCQQQRRMQLPLRELPGELVHGVVLAMRSVSQAKPALSGHFSHIETVIHSTYDEARTRVAIASRLIASIGAFAPAALCVAESGIPLFLTALGNATGLSRDHLILAVSDRQVVRLALTLRAAGLNANRVTEQLVLLGLDADLPEGFDQIGPEQAAAMLMSDRHAAGTGE